MKIFIRGAAAALALSLVGVTGAEAQIVTPTWINGFGDGTCVNASFSNFVGAQPGASASCIGLYPGNNVGNASTTQFALDQINSAFGTSVTAGATVQANSSDAQVGFTADGGGNTGTISFVNPFTGSFLFALKAGNAWSAYLLSGLVDVTEFDYQSFSQNGGSHLTYYNHDISVPEPTTLFLLGTGLLGMSFVVWRRREEILA